MALVFKQLYKIKLFNYRGSPWSSGERARLATRRSAVRISTPTNQFLDMLANFLYDDGSDFEERLGLIVIKFCKCFSNIMVQILKSTRVTILEGAGPHEAMEKEREIMSTTLLSKICSYQKHLIKNFRKNLCLSFTLSAYK